MSSLEKTAWFGRLWRHPVSRATALRVGSLVVGIVSSVLLARLGGADVKGVSSSFAAANAVGFMIVNFDLAQQVLRESRARKSIPEVLPTLVRAWALYVVLGAIAIVVALLVNVPTAWLIGGCLAYLLGAQAGVATTGVAGPVAGAVGGVAQQMGLIIGTVGFWALGVLDTGTVRWVVILSYLLPMVIYIPYMRRSGAWGGLRVRTVPILRLFAGGSIWQIGRLMQMLLQKLDTLVVFAALGAAAAGVYSVALSTAMLCTVIPAQFANNALYEASRGMAAKVGRNSAQALVSGLALAAGLAALGLPAVLILYGSDFRGAYPVLLTALGGAVAYGVVQVQTNYIRILGQWFHLALASASGLFVMALGLALLVGPWGAMGAGASFTVGTIVAALVGTFVLRRIAKRWRNVS